jgi:dolichyl-diphosphooligosaccharide--protein glycosyltransferase
MQVLTTAPRRPSPHRFLLLFSRWSDSTSFLLLYAYTAYFFASKMSRLIILLGPVASALGGVTLGYAFDYLLISALVEGMPTQEAEGKESADDKTVDLATISPRAGHELATPWMGSDCLG